MQNSANMLFAIKVMVKKEKNMPYNNKHIAKTLISIFLAITLLFTFSGCDIIFGFTQSLTITATYVGEDITQGEALDQTDISVQATYTDKISGYTETYTVTDFTVSGFDCNKLGKQTISISYTEGGMVATTTVQITVVEKIPPAPKGITAKYTGEPLQIGDKIDKSLFEVVVTFEDNTKEQVADFIISGVNTATSGEQIATITYYYQAKLTDPYTVLVTTAKITVLPPPAVFQIIVANYVGPTLEVGDALDKSNIVVEEVYSDGSKVPVENFTISDIDTSTAGNKNVTVFVEKDGSQLTATVVVAVLQKEVVLTSLSATFVGKNVTVADTLNTSHFQVTATYSDNTTAVIAIFDISQVTFDTAGTHKIQITYTYKDVTKSCEVSVVIDPAPVVLEKISVEFLLSEFFLSSTLQTSDFTVKAHLTDGKSFNVSDYTISQTQFEEVGEHVVIITYSQNGVEKSCEVIINVLDDSAVEEVANYGKYGVLSTDGKSVKIINTANNSSTTNLQIHFLELGNQYAGDSVYIKAGDNDILIDAGSRKSSAKTIGDYIDKYCTDGILEYVIATHAHQDHIAGFVGSTTRGEEGIFERYQCQTIIDYPLKNTNSEISQDYVAERDAEVASGAKRYSALECYNNDNATTRFTQSVTATGARRYIKLADNLEMEILYNYFYDHTTSDENDYSVCLLINQYGDGYDYSNPSAEDNEQYVNSFLFTGDLEERGEKYLVQYNDLPNVVLFKGGHHGSPTSTTTELLAETNPKTICLCTCAGSAEYSDNLANQFPGMAMMQRVSAYTDMVFATSLYNSKYSLGGTPYSMNGNITITCNRMGVYITASNNLTLLKDTDWFKNRYTEWSQDIALRSDAV